MPLTPEQIEDRLNALEERNVELEALLHSGRPDSRLPLLATAFDMEDTIFPPMARVYHGGATTIGNGSIGTLSFTSERYDTDSIHNTSTNAGRLTAQTAGIYSISGNVEWASSPTSGLIRILLNGATIIAASRVVSADYRIMSITTYYDLALADYVELQVLQNSGGDLNINSTGNYSPEFMMAWRGPPS